MFECTTCSMYVKHQSPPRHKSWMQQKAKENPSSEKATMSLAVEHVSNMPLSASPLKVSTLGRGRLDSVGMFPIIDENDSYEDNCSHGYGIAMSTCTFSVNDCESKREDETTSMISRDSISASDELFMASSSYDCASTFDESEASAEEFSCSTKKEATALLRNFHEVPSDFVATAVVRADANVVQTARDTLKLNKKLAAMASVVFPFVLPVFWLQRDMREMSAKLTMGAEDDIYVIGNKGYATLNKGHLKAYTPSCGASLEEDTTFFKSDSCAGCFRLTKARQQSVLAINEYGTGQCMQLWFVNPRTQRFLSTSAYACRGSMKSMKDLARRSELL